MLDLILLCVLGLAILNGFARGLVSALFSWGVYIVGFFLAITLASSVGNLVGNALGVQHLVHSYLSSRLPSYVANAHVTASSLASALRMLSIPDILKQMLIPGLHGSGTVMDLLTGAIASGLNKVLGFIVVLYASQLVLGVVLRPLAAPLRWLVPKVLDRLGGAVFGLFNGMLELWGLVLVTPYLVHVPGVPAAFVAALENSHVLAFVSSTFAPFVHWFTDALKLPTTSWPPSGGGTPL